MNNQADTGNGVDAVIEVEDVHKHYPGVRAVDGISFTVQRGEIFGMVGPNGAGKSTTIECIEGLRSPDNGHIRVLGLDPCQDSYALREHIGIQFQTAALPARIKVQEALDLFAAFYRQSVDTRSLLAQMGLADKGNAYLAKLSGGQRQRIFIALALVNNPHVVFLDELTTGLDPQSRRTMWDMVLDIRRQGKTVFLTTHFMEEAERLCDRVAIMDHGTIVALDTPANLIALLTTESRVTFTLTGPCDEALLQSAPGVTRVERMGQRMVVYGAKEQLLSGVVNALESHRVPFTDLRTEQPTLEDVFLALTGREMRD
ncbi:MAG: ABC transporter ATP-binding protein [Chloroflexales bacterium]|nr:ABC transporter ATP-binding protein [Chloroflexales bacterium]